MKTGFKVEMFAADVKISKRVTEFKRLLHVQDVGRESVIQSLTFHKNEQLINVLNTISVVGTLTEEVVFLIRQKRELFSYFKKESANKVNIKLPEDQQVPSITGCVLLPDGRIVLCGRKNDNLKLLSTKCLDLPTSPHDVSAVTDTTVIVTLAGRQQLEYIEVVPSL